MDSLNDRPAEPHRPGRHGVPPSTVQDELMTLPNFDLDDYVATRRGYNEAAKTQADNKLRGFVAAVKLLEAQYEALETVAREQAVEVVDLRVRLGGHEGKKFKPAQEWHITALQGDIQNLTDAVIRLSQEPRTYTVDQVVDGWIDITENVNSARAPGWFEAQCNWSTDTGFCTWATSGSETVVVDAAYEHAETHVTKESK